MDLLAHSAGASVALLYATRFAHRLRRLVLVTPSLRLLLTAPVGMAQAYARRAGEPWYAEPETFAATVERFLAGWLTRAAGARCR